MTLAPTSRISAGGSAGGKVTIDAGDGDLRCRGRDRRGRQRRPAAARSACSAATSGSAAPAVDASGASGGGEILVGGDYQGANPAVANAAHLRK